MSRILFRYLCPVLLASVLVGCAPASPGQPPTAAPSSTPAPPSVAPSPLPTLTRTPSGTATPRIGFPKPAGEVADVIGFWKTRIKGANVDVTVEFRPDGTFDLNEIGASGHPVDKFDGSYSVSKGQLILDADRCNRWIAAGQVEFFHCQGIYKVSSSYRGDTPAQLRFVLVEDGDQERAHWFMDQTFFLVEDEG